MSTAGEEPRLAGLVMVDPHLAEGSLGRSWVVVPGTGADRLPFEDRPPSVTIDGAGRRFDLVEWWSETFSTALQVVVGGATVLSWSAEHVAPTSLLLGASMTKSVLAHLVGAAVEAGDLRLTDRVVDHVPELSGSGWAVCTVHDVATMTSGVDWVEDHRDPDGPASRLVAAFSEGGSSRTLLTGVGAAVAPGTRWEYSTADSQVLDWVRERATGASYVEALGDLWRALGCRFDAVVGTDSDGVALAGGALAATSHDWARVGMHQLAGDWAETSSRPAYPFTRPGRLPSTITTHAGFGMHWWPLDDAGRRVMADGSRGQLCLVDRDHDVVVVKTSEWPYADAWADRHYRDLSYLGLQAICDAVIGGEEPS